MNIQAFQVVPCFLDTRWSPKGPEVKIRKIHQTENALAPLKDVIVRTVIGSHLPAHPSSLGGQVTLARPAGPEVDGSKERSTHDGKEVIRMSERTFPMVETSQGQAKSISPTGLELLPLDPPTVHLISVLGPLLLLQVLPLKG